MRTLIAAILIMAASPALSGERLPPEEAKNFVAGKWWKFSCPVGLAGVGLVNRDGSVVAKAKADSWWLSGLLWPFFGDGRTLKTFQARTFEATPSSVCGKLVVSLCFTVERLNEKQFIGYNKSSPSYYCNFSHTTAPPS